MSSGICGQRRPRSACASAQSDQGLRCPLKDSLDTTKCINGEKCPDETSRMRGMNLNLCIFCACSKTHFLLGAARFYFPHGAYSGILENWVPRKPVRKCVIRHMRAAKMCHQADAGPCPAKMCHQA